MLKALQNCQGTFATFSEQDTLLSSLPCCCEMGESPSPTFVFEPFVIDREGGRRDIQWREGGDLSHLFRFSGIATKHGQMRIDSFSYPLFFLLPAFHFKKFKKGVILIGTSFEEANLLPTYGCRRRRNCSPIPFTSLLPSISTALHNAPTNQPRKTGRDERRRWLPHFRFPDNTS